MAVRYTSSFLVLGGTDCYMLAAMAYDGYNAICHPLSCCIIMKRKVCMGLVVGSGIIGAINGVIQTSLTFSLPFCGANKLNPFFCDISPVLELACANTWVITVITSCGWVVLASFTLIIISYVHMICTIGNKRPVSGRRKAFSTCTSYFTAVTIFYGPGIFMYIRPKLKYSMNQDRVIAVMYIIIAPLLNPFIYSLIKNNLKVAFNRILQGLTPESPSIAQRMNGKNNYHIRMR